MTNRLADLESTILLARRSKQAKPGRAKAPAAAPPRGALPRRAAAAPPPLTAAPAATPVTARGLGGLVSRWPARAAVHARSLGAVDYTIPGLFAPLAQPSSMACWAAVYAMLLSWRRQQSLTIEDALNQTGQHWVDLFRGNKGLPGDEHAAFFAAAGLVAEPLASFSVDGWEQMLRNYGPIIVTANEAPGRAWAMHARVITAVRGDGSAENTLFTMVDPAGGRTYQESISTFIPKYEDEIRRTGDSRIQVAHWSADARAEVRAQSFGRHVPDKGAAVRPHARPRLPESCREARAFKLPDQLVLGEAVPAVSEVAACGAMKKKIKRSDPEFAGLVSNANPNIVFKDEERTGADRMMTPRLRDALDSLAAATTNEWAGSKLRVTEAWDEDNEHAGSSLHYEGRAADLTTDPIDGAKLGRLARLAVEAGCDWVLYENSAHIHVSVKEASS